MTGDTLDILHVRPVTADDVRSFSAWRYEPPYDVYAVTGHSLDETIGYFLGSDVNCHVLEDAGNLIGFITFGEDARVPGGDYSAPALDIGLGIRPDATGRGSGSRFVGAVIEFATEHLDAAVLRVTIAEWNTRALRVWEHAGFGRVQRFETPDGFEAMGGGAFVVLDRHDPA